MRRLRGQIQLCSVSAVLSVTMPFRLYSCPSPITSVLNLRSCLSPRSLALAKVRDCFLLPLLTTLTSLALLRFGVHGGPARDAHGEVGAWVTQQGVNAWLCSKSSSSNAHTPSLTLVQGHRNDLGARHGHHPLMQQPLHRLVRVSACVGPCVRAGWRQLCKCARPQVQVRSPAGQTHE